MKIELIKMCMVINHCIVSSLFVSFCILYKSDAELFEAVLCILQYDVIYTVIIVYVILV